MILTVRGSGPGRLTQAGTLTWAGDRVGTARADDGATLDVIIPNGLWPVAGQRVALCRYPGGWVVTGVWVSRPPGRR